MGLATVASDLVGQGLSTTRFFNKSIDALPILQRVALEVSGLPGDLRTVYAGLADGNLRVASDMLPIYDIFNNLGGYSGLGAIGDTRINALTGQLDPVPAAALEGYQLLDNGRQISRGLMQGSAAAMYGASLNTLALHEQRDVLQPVYDNKFMGKTLGNAVDNQLSLLGAGNSVIGSKFNPLAPNFLGTDVNPNDVLSNTPLMSRSLGALDQRISFVGKIADTFVSNMNQLGRAGTINFLGNLRLNNGIGHSSSPRNYSLKS